MSPYVDKKSVDEKSHDVDAVVKVGPWQRLSREQVYENPWISLSHERVLTPAGSEGIYGKIHFKNLAIGIVALDHDGNTWLVGQHRYTLDAFSWEIPMGGGPLTEDPLMSAQRELREETGFRAGSWRQLLKLHTSNSVTDEAGLVFLATELVAGAQSLEDSESDIIVKKLPLADAVAMVLDGEISDAVSVAALLAADRLLR